MKSIFTIVFVVFVTMVNCSNNTSNQKQTLPAFSITLYYGDEAINTYKINVYSIGQDFYADNITPYFYYGRQTDSAWTIKLDENKVSICHKFLDKARLLPRQCNLRSSASEHYIIVSQNDSIEIRGNCNWDSLDFFSLREILFKEKFLEIESKRSSIIADLNKKLIGKWFFQPFKQEPKKDDYFILSKTNPFKSNCYWQFEDSLSFKSSCNKNLDLTYSDQYQWLVEGDIYLQIMAGFVVDKEGNMTVENDGADFILDTLTDSTLELKFSWR